MLFKDFIYILAAYIIIKIGYMVLFNNFFHLVTLKGKKAKGTYLDKFSRILGYALIFIGLITALLIVLKRYFPNYYLYAYGTVIFATAAFLLIKFFSYRSEEKEAISDGK
ncbi:MAG: hypothetical protein PHH19_02840 [Eubacteriales bacterium]|nr:hypothetical protein [Eubacteriales bacterium]